MINFTLGKEVAVDDLVTSDQINSVALAGNSRARAVGDVPWRVGFYLFNSARQVRNPDEFLWPSLGEYWEHYQHANPDVDQRWPEADPGEPEGANLASTMMGFVHGNPGALPEIERLYKEDEWGGNLLQPANLGATPAQVWYYGQRQRGAYDPATGSQNVPAFEAAQDYAHVDQLSTEVWYPVESAGVVSLALSGMGTQAHGRSYGGYLPQPEYLGHCNDADQTPSFEYIFSALRAGVTTNGTNPCTGTAAMIFTGSCPSWTPGYSPTHVRGILRTTHAYFVVLWNGTIYTLPTKDYTEGPYCSGGALEKPAGDQIARLALHSYVKDFRGSDDDRALPGYNVEDYGFDFDRFDRSQYFLSPNIGHADGEYIVGDYPLYRWTGAASHAAGSYGVYAGGGTTHAYQTGYVLGGAFLLAAKLTAPVTVELVGTSGAVLREITLAPDENGDASAVTWFEDAPTPAPLSVRLKTAAVFDDDTGTLEVECTEQMAYKPEAHDRYLWLRMASTTGATTGNVDGRGTDCPTPRALSDAYFASGCIVSRTPASIYGDPATVNDNAGFDAFRRFTRDKFRIQRRQQAIGYAVESGKSVLWFKRYSYLNSSFDLFEGIAPPAAAMTPGGLENGIEYVVRSGSITYGSTTYSAGQRFTATTDPEFTGTGLLYVYNGIRHTAPPGGHSNEWLMNVETQLYHPSNNNLWKPAAVADFFAYCQRCHVLAPRISGTQNLDLRRHFNYGMSMLISPEAPPGYHYAGTANTFTGWTTEQRVRFYKSCRIYEPWPEIESAIIEIEGGEEIVKLTFTGRFHHCGTEEDGFSGDLARDMTTWTATQLNGEKFRSFENGIRQYLYHIHRGGLEGDYHPPPKIGDMGAEAPTPSGNPYGSVYPHFFFLKLIPLVHADSNTTVEETDTPIVMDTAQHAELFARGMCEAFVDSVTSKSYGCQLYVTMAYDYRWENLLFQAASGRWLGSLPGEARPDGMSGFSALPSTVLYAEVFSQLARAYNLLDKLRLLLPMQLLYRTNAYRGTMAVTPQWDTGSKAVWTGAPPPATTPDPFGWSDWEVWADGMGATSAAHLQITGTGWEMVTVRDVVQFKLELLDANAIHALPSAFHDMLEGQSGFVGWNSTALLWYVGVPVTVESEAQDCPDNSGMDRFFWNGSGWRFEAYPEPPDNETRTCDVFTSGTMDPGTPPSGTFRADGAGVCANSSFRSIGVEPASQLGRFVTCPLVAHTE